MTVIAKPENEPPLFGGGVQIVVGGRLPRMKNMPDTLTGDKPMAKLLRAIAFAEERHRGQTRKDAARTPYISHPIRVASILADEGGVTDVDILAGAALHDLVEDTATSFYEIETLFGDVVAGLVAEVTDDKTLPAATRKQRQIEHAPNLSHGAKLIKLADKIANVRDLQDAPPVDWDNRRRGDYAEWSDRVVSGLEGCSIPLERSYWDLRQR